MVTHSPAIPSRQEVRAEFARRSLYEFVVQAWPILEPAVPFQTGWHIQAVTEHLEAVSLGNILRLIINIPPRHAKSTLTSVCWPAWDWIDHPYRQFLSSSYAQSLSTRDSVKTRRLIQSRWYQRNWGTRYRFAGDQNAKIRFENDQMGYRIATSVEGSATGEGGGILLIDDPHSISEAESDTVRQGVLDWWDGTMSTRLNDPKTGAVVVIMQRVHDLDLSGHLLAQGGWEHLCLPAEYEGEKHYTIIGWEDPRTVEGELLWPDRFGPEEIAKQKIILGSYRYSGQYQQRPAPRTGGIFNSSWWKFYQLSDLPRYPHDHLTRPDELRFDDIIQSWDMTFKDLTTSDFVVGQVWGRKGADYYLLDQERGQLSFTDTLKAVKQMRMKWPKTTATLVEDKANGTAIIDTLRHDIPGLLPIEPQGGKIARAEAVSPTIEAGNVYLPSPQEQPWIQTLLDEAARFPLGTHDDQVDALTQALNWMNQVAEVRVRIIR